MSVRNVTIKLNHALNEIIKNHFNNNIELITMSKLNNLISLKLINKEQKNLLKKLKINYNKYKKGEINLKLIKSKSKSKTKSKSKSKSNSKSKSKTKTYNVNRYYLNRLKKYDPELFKTQKIERINRYAVKCGAVIDRQPIAVTKEMLENYNSTSEGIGKTFANALNIPERDPNIYYICPKYWDVKNEKPRNPSELHTFKDHIVDHKMTTSEKKNTKKYILERNGRGYWNEANNDISRYIVKLYDDGHSDGFKLPCCYSRKPRVFKPGYNVLVKQNGKSFSGIVISSTEETVTVNGNGTIKIYPIENVIINNKK